MATMTIRNFDDNLKQRLRIRAARHGRSMEDEARDILRNTLSTDTARRVSLVASIRSRIEPLGCVELELPARGATLATRNIGDFEGCGIEVIDPRSATAS